MKLKNSPYRNSFITRTVVIMVLSLFVLEMAETYSSFNDIHETTLEIDFEDQEETEEKESMNDLFVYHSILSNSKYRLNNTFNRCYRVPLLLPPNYSTETPPPEL